MKVLIVGECYSSNLGDGVICETVQKICQFDYKCETYSFDISGKEDFDVYDEKKFSIKDLEIKRKYKSKLRYISRYIYIIKSDFRRWKLIKNKLANINYDDIDIVIFAGGQMLIDYFSIPIYLIVKAMDKNQKKVVFNCLGMGQNRNILKRMFLKKAISSKNIIGISLRDGLETFNKFFLPSNKFIIEQILDPAIHASEYYCNLDKYKKKIIGIGIIDPTVFESNNINFILEDYIEIIEKIINKLDKSKMEYEFFTNGSLSDYEFMVYLKGRFNIKSPNIKINLPRDLVSNIAGFSAIISFRLHSHIIAVSQHKPTIGFIWNDKIREFANVIGAEEDFLELEDNKLIQKIYDRIDCLEKRNVRYEKLRDYTTTKENLSKYFS